MLSKINLTDEADFQGIRESALVDFKTKENSKNRERAQEYAIAAQSILNAFASLISKMADCQFTDRLSIIMKKIGVVGKQQCRVFGN